MDPSGGVNSGSYTNGIPYQQTGQGGSLNIQATPDKRPKKRVKQLTIIGILLLIVISSIVIATNTLGRISSDDATASLETLRDSLSEIEFHLQPLYEGDMSISNVDHELIAKLNDKIQVSNSSFAKIQNVRGISFASTETNKSFLNTRDEIGRRLSIYEQQIALLNNILIGFIDDLERIIFGINYEEYITSWAPNETAKSLLNNPDVNIAQVASQLNDTINSIVRLTNDADQMGCLSIIADYCYWWVAEYSETITVADDGSVLAPLVYSNRIDFEADMRIESIISSTLYLLAPGDTQ